MPGAEPGSAPQAAHSGPFRTPPHSWPGWTSADPVAPLTGGIGVSRGAGRAAGRRRCLESARSRRTA